MIRKAVVEDIDALRLVYDEARERMIDSGNPRQWAPGYPPLSLIKSEIEAIADNTEKNVPEIYEEPTALRSRSAENDLISRPSPIITGMFASPKRKKGRGFGTKSSSEEKNSDREARYTALSRNRIDITSLS